MNQSFQCWWQICNPKPLYIEGILHFFHIFGIISLTWISTDRGDQRRKYRILVHHWRWPGFIFQQTNIYIYRERERELIISIFRFLKASYNNAFQTSNVLKATRNYLIKKGLHWSFLFHWWMSVHHNLIYNLAPLKWRKWKFIFDWNFERV